MTDISADMSADMSADLRALVREVLRETLPAAVTQLPPVAAGPATAGERPAPEPVAEPDAEPDAEPEVRPVAVGSDADLDALVRAVARECDDPARRARLADGSVRYRLSAAVAPTAAPGDGDGDGLAPLPPPDLRVERGAVTERHVRQAERTGARVVAARGVVVTPLARDRARSVGVDIAKEQ